MEIKDLLISWYLQHKRLLPWRNTNDPYKIWLSEIILQQTRVDQGMDYYLRFAEAFPDVFGLAKAEEQVVLKLWQGLGYYSRARNLLATARVIANEHQGKFPNTYEGLIGLKGIGPYTAAAIGSFAFGLPHAVVDGNVMRVLSRVFDVQEAVNAGKGKKTIDELAEYCLSKKDPGTYNQAIMELGALVCTPSNPQCTACPLSVKCLSLANKTVHLRPVKVKKQKATLRQIDYAVITSAAQIVFRLRKEKDIWQGLHDFPSVESEHEKDALIRLVKESYPENEIARVPTLPEKSYTHQLTHRRIEARFWRFEMFGDIPKNSIYLNVDKKDVDSLAVPRLIHKYLEDANMI